MWLALGMWTTSCKGNTPFFLHWTASRRSLNWLFNNIKKTCKDRISVFPEIKHVWERWSVGLYKNNPLCNIFKHKSFRGCAKQVCRYLWSSTTIREQSSNKLVHELVFITFVSFPCWIWLRRLSHSAAISIESMGDDEEEWASSKCHPALTDMGRHEMEHK